MAPLLVGHPDRGGVGDPLVAGEELLDLARDTFSPPDTIISSSRPSMNRRPAASKCPTSPVDMSPPIVSLVPPPV
jgi:hypothetical protein